VAQWKVHVYPHRASVLGAELKSLMSQGIMGNRSDRNSKRLPEHHSPLRSMMAEASGSIYTAIETLVAAREHPGSVVIFEGDDGGTIYLTILAREVACDERALGQLLIDIDAMCWSDSSMARIVYEVVPAGAAVAGGMGGGRVIDGLWLHPRVEALGMRENIQQVLHGRRDQIDTDGKHWR
jgi:hypothetical protein